MITQDLIAQYLGSNPVVYLMAGIAVLVVVNLLVSIWLAHKSPTDGVKFHMLPDFIAPLTQYIVFLFVLEVLVVSTNGIPTLSASFQGLQLFGFITILIKYFRQIYDKLKKLGMPTDPAMDQEIDNQLNNIINSVTNGSVVVTKPNPTPTPQPDPQDYVPSNDAVIVNSDPNEGRPEEDNR